MFALVILSFFDTSRILRLTSFPIVLKLKPDILLSLRLSSSKNSNFSRCEIPISSSSVPSNLSFLSFDNLEMFAKLALVILVVNT